MTLKDRFKQWLDTAPRYEIREVQLEVIADDYTIDFALWKDANATKDIEGMFYGESRIGISRNNPVDIYQLLEIYKKEKGL